MAEQKQQQPSRFKFIWGGTAPPTTRSTPTRSASGLDRTTTSTPFVRRQPTRQSQPQPQPSSQSRPSVQPRGGTSPSTSTSNAPRETNKNKVEEQKLPEKTPPPISKATDSDSSQKPESKPESLKSASTSVASEKPEVLPEHKSSTFEAETSPKNTLKEAHKQTTVAKEPALLVPQETTKATTSSLEKTQKSTPTSTSDVTQKTEPSTTKEPALLDPTETKNPTTSSPGASQKPIPTIESSISESHVAQKNESSTTKESALFVQQETKNPTTFSPEASQKPIPTIESSIPKSEFAQKTKSSTTKEPALLVPQETPNPTTSSPDTSQKPIPSIESSSISTSPPKSELETITKETLSEKLPQEAEKTILLPTTRDVIKIVRESDHKITTTSPTNKETKEDNNISSLVKKTGFDNPKYEGKQVTVITLAGENRGASMQLGSDAAKEAIQIHRGYKMNQSEDINNDNKSKETNENDNEGPIMRTLINNNVQSINNSIVFNSSVTKRDPGVHFAFPRAVKEDELVKSREKKETFLARKMQFEATPSNQVAYEPRIRRRCLKGLLMESSDSDSPDIPGKNRRHGCRYVREEKESNSDMHIQIN